LHINHLSKQKFKFHIKMKTTFLIFPLILLASISHADHDDDDNCVWVQNNINTNGEHLAGMVSSRDECVHLVLTECPSATIANMAYNIGDSADCWCQYGTDMTPNPSSYYTNCLISSLSDEYKEYLYSTYGAESESTYQCQFVNNLLSSEYVEDKYNEAANSCVIGETEYTSGRSYDDSKDENEFNVNDYDSEEENMKKYDRACCKDNYIETIVIIVIIVIILLIISCICCCIHCCECCKPLRCCNKGSSNEQQRPVQGIELQPQPQRIVPMPMQQQFQPRQQQQYQYQPRQQQQQQFQPRELLPAVQQQRQFQPQSPNYAQPQNYVVERGTEGTNTNVCIPNN
jgi:hypothetical protein